MKKILAIMPKSIGGRLTTSSFIDGFIENGYEVRIFDELYHKNFSQILDENYKYIIGYDFSPIKLKTDFNLKIPCISYFSDVIESRASGVLEEWKKYYNELKKEDNYVFYWDRTLAIQDGWNYMPHFVNLKIYRNYKTPRIDVLFAGRLDTDLRLKTYLNLNKLLPQLTFCYYAIEKHYQDALSRCKNNSEREILRKTYGGFIDNEEDMASLINDSKIVYNINSQGISSLNYRTIQTLACQRLIISDAREELVLFDNIIPTWSSVDELAHKIEYYLKNQKKYDEITQKARKLVELNHDCVICVKKMLDKIRV